MCSLRPGSGIVAWTVASSASSIATWAESQSDGSASGTSSVGGSRRTECAPAVRKPATEAAISSNANPGPTITKAGSAKITPRTPPAAMKWEIRRSPGNSSSATPEPSSRQPGTIEKTKPTKRCSGALHSQKSPATSGIQASLGQRTVSSKASSPFERTGRMNEPVVRVGWSELSGT